MHLFVPPMLIIVPYNCRLCHDDDLGTSSCRITSLCLADLWNIPIQIQQDAKLHSLFISGNCCTCFGWYLHPSSGAHTQLYLEHLVLVEQLLLPAA